MNKKEENSTRIHINAASLLDEIFPCASTYSWVDRMFVKLSPHQKSSFNVVNYSLKSISRSGFCSGKSVFIRVLLLACEGREKCYCRAHEWKTHIVDEQKSLSREKLSRKEAKKFDSEANRNKFSSRCRSLESSLVQSVIIIDRFCHIFFVCHIW